MKGSLVMKFYPYYKTSDMQLFKAELKAALNLPTRSSKFTKNLKVCYYWWSKKNILNVERSKARVSNEKSPDILEASTENDLDHITGILNNPFLRSVFLSRVSKLCET